MTYKETKKKPGKNSTRMIKKRIKGGERGKERMT
jgi:hypothetical protein